MALSNIFVKVFCIKEFYKKIILDYCINSRLCNYVKRAVIGPLQCDALNPTISLRTRQPWNSCGFWVTRYHIVVSHLSRSIFSQKLGRVSFVRGALPNIQPV